ncbi:MAG: desulfoferrodoxin [Proteobacteria bacterium]|nr:desulfoferrodoxin [Pseudomonadota bacterium]
MVERMQVYKCDLCGNTVDIAHAGGGQLACCNQPMTLMEEKNADQGVEKHLPVVEKADKRIKVTVGSTAHPMEDKHFIEWIETVTGDAVSRKYLKPGDTPERSFCYKKDQLRVRAYCNLHGLWTQKEV